MADRVGQQFGKYRLIRLLGQGEVAAVYLGQHLSLQTLAAVKVFSLPLTGRDAQSFGSQVSVLARQAHPSLLRVLEGGMEGDVPFVVAEYAPDGSLRTRHARGTSLPAPVVLTYLKPIVAALSYLHERRLVHGALKPENMLLAGSNAIVLSEVNLPVLRQRRHSHLLEQGASSVSYLAPEQLQGQALPASDQYALGVVVYEWLSGDVPFRGSFQEVSQQQLAVPPASLHGKVPEISSYAEDVVLRALARDPSQRFASVQAFAGALEQACQATQPIGEHLLPGTLERPPLAPSLNMSPPITGAAIPGTLLCIYRGHEHVVNAVAWSPDGARLASGSRDKTVQIWEAATGKRLLSYGGHTDRVLAVAWSLDGTRLASTGTDGTVKVWDAATGRTLLAYRSQAPLVHALAWSPDGTRLASDSAQMVDVWESVTGSRLLSYRSHAYGVNALAWSPDGKYLASASNDHTVQVWDAASGSTRFTYRGHTDDVLALAWSPDGQFLASGSSDHTVQVWGSVPISTRSTYRGQTSGVRALAWSPDGRRIASADEEGIVHLWDVATEENVFSYRGHLAALAIRVNAVAWSPDGQHIASAGDDGTVQVWRAL